MITNFLRHVRTSILSISMIAIAACGAQHAETSTPIGTKIYNTTLPPELGLEGHTTTVVELQVYKRDRFGRVVTATDPDTGKVLPIVEKTSTHLYVKHTLTGEIMKIALSKALDVAGGVILQQTAPDCADCGGVLVQNVVQATSVAEAELRNLKSYERVPLN